MVGEWLTGPRERLTRFGEVPRFREGLYRLAGRGNTGCYAWLVPNGSWGETNIGLIDCGGKSVLIDTCWDLRFTQEVMQHTGDILRRSPVSHVINTHADGDHCWGNQLFADREIIASHACIRQMHHFSPRSLTALQRAGGLLHYLPFGKVDKLGHYLGTMFRPYDFGGVRILPAGTGFSGEKTITVNGTDIHLFEVGPGHTDGDIIVHVPSQRVLYAADTLFVNATPVAWAGPVDNLVQSLHRLLEFDVDVYVPGHGPLCDRAAVGRVIAYWDFIQEALHRRFQRDMAPAEAARDLALSREFAASGFAGWDSPERIVTNAFTLYRGWGARLPSLPGVLGPLNILRQQAALAFELAGATPRIMRQF